MFKLVSDEISQYCEDHSTLPSQVCKDLEEFTHDQVRMSIMLSGPLVGSFLGFLVSVTKTKRVLEIGCYTGYSALCMAEHLPTDGELITLDINPETDTVANRYWRLSPHGKKIKSIIGPALTTLDSLKSTFDLVFIDADKPNYVNYLPKALSLLNPNGVIIADNCLYSGKVLQEKPSEENTAALKAFNELVHGDPTLECTLLPVRDGLMLIRKK